MMAIVPLLEEVHLQCEFEMIEVSSGVWNHCTVNMPRLLTRTA
jgi:hypothetical protein